MTAGAATLAVIILLVLQFHTHDDAAEHLAFKARRIDLVEEMRVALASASEAEKSAVMAITDQDSEKLAGEARAANAEVERRRK